MAHAGHDDLIDIERFFECRESSSRPGLRAEAQHVVPPTPIRAGPSGHVEDQPTHERLKDLLVSIAELLHKHARTEVTEGPFRYDVIWTDDPEAQVAPSHAFEVQVKGNIEAALSKLQHARHVWRCELSLVVVDERDGQRARQLVEERYTRGAFHPIRDPGPICSFSVRETLRDCTAR